MEDDKDMKLKWGEKEVVFRHKGLRTLTPGWRATIGESEVRVFLRAGYYWEASCWYQAGSGGDENTPQAALDSLRSRIKEYVARLHAVAVVGDTQETQAPDEHAETMKLRWGNREVIFRLGEKRFWTAQIAHSEMRLRRSLTWSMWGCSYKDASSSSENSAQKALDVMYRGMWADLSGEEYEAAVAYGEKE